MYTYIYPIKNLNWLICRHPNKLLFVIIKVNCYLKVFKEMDLYLVFDTISSVFDV